MTCDIHISITEEFKRRLHKQVIPVDVRILFFGRRSAESFAHRVIIANRDSTSDVKQLFSFTQAQNNTPG